MAPAVGPQKVTNAIDTFRDAHNARDWDAVRALLTDDFAFVDHRPAGFGPDAGAEAYLRTLRSAIELVPDRQMRDFSPVAAGSTAFRMRAEGTDEFGSTIEWEFIAVFGMHDERLSSLDVFALDDVEAATRRAAELIARA